ncbi:hypothetical protein KQ247_18540 [Ruegeria pomeroyi]|jgi:hypothetical protein|uniref:Uncharacterized protein n=1 Tax=Ruegeria pomeroyi TaxID=89184 RepID=A0A850LHF8_9RHOB|nr:hypothetical protein [Ruegeria pomeroyi]NVK97446.1 hypothetical protein [Ruegeria pomeroyi]NVL00557.1 hypothetical protein [Ruegeria pomeroyi]QWV08776.1 hypothetical protein KQ247_18540 [Ruegeria pomeroyi]
MFAPSGWISLYEVFYLISAAFRERGRIGQYNFTGDENFEVTWLFIQETPEVAVCLPNGTVLPASRTLVLPEDHFDNLNEHIDLMIGTVGSAHSPRHQEVSISKEELRLRYGPFLHLPIIFQKKDFDEFFDELDKAPEHFLDSSRPTTEYSDSVKDLSPRRLAGEIVALFDSNALTKFDDVKRSLAPTHSVRQFRFAWNLARELRPAISRPGRKPAANKS